MQLTEPSKYVRLTMPIPKVAELMKDSENQSVLVSDDHFFSLGMRINKTKTRLEFKLLLSKISHMSRE